MPIDVLAEVLVNLALDRGDQTTPVISQSATPLSSFEFSSNDMGKIKDISIDDLSSSTPNEGKEDPLQDVPLDAWLAKVRKDIE